MKRNENRKKQNLCTAENPRALKLPQFRRKKHSPFPPPEKHRRKLVIPVPVPEQRQKKIRYGYRNPAGCPVRRPFLIADNLFRLKKDRLRCAQRRYAVRFGKNGTEFTVNIKYQTIPGGER